jgi:uncharacterized protein YuzE
MYIKLADKKVGKTRQIADGIMIDFSAHDEIIGIEILYPRSVILTLMRSPASILANQKPRALDEQQGHAAVIPTSSPTAPPRCDRCR